jgi:hypothetical protein
MSAQKSKDVITKSPMAKQMRVDALEDIEDEEIANDQEM